MEELERLRREAEEGPGGLSPAHVPVASIVLIGLIKVAEAASHLLATRRDAARDRLSEAIDCLEAASSKGGERE